LRRWVILAVLLAMLLGVAWWFFFISPRQGRIAQAKDDLVAAQQTADDLNRQIADLQAIRDSEVEFLAGIGKLEALIPERPLLEDFIDDVYALCNTTGVDLLNLAPAMPVPMTDSDLRQITVAATVDGDFFEVLGFLFGIKDMDRLVRVDAISVSSGQDETGATSLSVSISMRLFTLADLVPIAVPPDDSGATPGDGTTDNTAPEAQTTIPPSTVPTTTAPSGEG
jgi:Tfp pilus assembly protein PilO